MKILETNLEELAAFMPTVPEFEDPPSLKEIRRRCEGRPWLALMAEEAGVRIGGKLGYQISESTFYSWVGGVLPDWRKQGVAQQLLEYQEDWVWRSGYERLQVKSMNRYPAMLRFLIANQYQIIGLEGSEPERIKVLFEKRRPKGAL